VDAVTGHTIRRVAVRRPAHEIPALTGVRLHSEEVAVVNASPRGMLIECGQWLPLRAAKYLELQSVDARLRVRGRVVRCQVARVTRDYLLYRVAFEFKEHIALLAGEPIQSVSAVSAETMVPEHRAE
jgi:hypothetical protein